MAISERRMLEWRSNSVTQCESSKYQVTSKGSLATACGV